jgi:hypothetical protein
MIRTRCKTNSGRSVWSTRSTRRRIRCKSEALARADLYGRRSRNSAGCNRNANQGSDQAGRSPSSIRPSAVSWVAQPIARTSNRITQVSLAFQGNGYVQIITQVRGGDGNMRHIRAAAVASLGYKRRAAARCGFVVLVGTKEPHIAAVVAVHMSRVPKWDLELLCFSQQPHHRAALFAAVVWVRGGTHLLR